MPSNIKVGDSEQATILISHYQCDFPPHIIVTKTSINEFKLVE